MSWNLAQLENLLLEQQGWAVCLESDCLCVTNSDGLDAYIAISGEQILAETVLFAKSQVKDVAALNEEILKTHQVFPLTTIGITHIADDDYYVAFGALSSQSKAGSIIIELEALFDNVSGFLDAYNDYLQ